MLSIRDLSIEFVQYERGLRRRITHPVQHLDLDVRAGEMVALVGASGSGKSLLAHGILGILPYNAMVSGRIEYDGEELTAARVQALRGKEICLVPQGVSWLDPLMKVGAQLEKGRRDKERRKRCIGALQRYGLGEEVTTLYPHQLSGGMARRVLLCTAAVERPRLIVADEPTPGLPLARARGILGHLRELAEEGAAVLLITHDVELALEFSHRIGVMFDGTVIEETATERFPRWESLQHPYARALSRALPCNEFFGGGAK